MAANMNPLITIDATHAGVDEAGRGPLVGSVFAAAVILPPDFRLDGLTDSKKLSEKKRDQYAASIKAHAHWCTAAATPDEILQHNILHATLLAMRRAIEGLGCTPEKVWIDGNRIPTGLTMPAQAVVQGDGKILAIAAASVLAKTARDAEMYELHRRHPQYGFDRHKGYGTAEHLAALQQYGPLPEHRRGFAPVKALIANRQATLFPTEPPAPRP